MAAAFEELDFSFVLHGCRARWEGAQISPFAGLGVFRARIEAVSA